MYFHKDFENSNIDILGDITWHYWTLGIQFNAGCITIKEMPELSENNFYCGFHILCFELNFNYWWKPK